MNFVWAFLATVCCVLGVVALTMLILFVAGFIERAYYARHGMIADSVRPLHVIEEVTPSGSTYYRAVYEYEVPPYNRPSPYLVTDTETFTIQGFRNKTREGAEKELREFVRIGYQKDKPEVARFVTLKFKIKK